MVQGSGTCLEGRVCRHLTAAGRRYHHGNGMDIDIDNYSVSGIERQAGLACAQFLASGGTASPSPVRDRVAAAQRSRFWWGTLHLTGRQSAPTARRMQVLTKDKGAGVLVLLQPLHPAPFSIRIGSVHVRHDCTAPIIQLLRHQGADNRPRRSSHPIDT